MPATPWGAMAAEAHSSLRDQGGACAARGARARRIAPLGEPSEARSAGVPGEREAPMNMAVGGITQQGGNLAGRLHLLLCAVGIIASLMLYSVLQVTPWPRLFNSAS